MVQIKTIASGSSGNCHIISDNGNHLMIEAGLTLPAIRAGLRDIGILLTDLDGCLISHDHGDHSKSAAKVMKAGINCYMSPGTAAALNLSGHRLKIIESNKQVKIDSWIIVPFPAVHDAVDPVCFLIQSPGGSKILFVTDSAYIKNRFRGLNYVMIEANYSPEILEENIRGSEYPRVIRNRVVKNHMSIMTTIETLKANDLSKVREIHLIHLSRDNADPVDFKRRVEAATGKLVFVS